MIDERTGIDFPFFQGQIPEIFEVHDPRDKIYQNRFLRVMDFSEFTPHFDHVVDFQGNPWSYKIYGNYVLEEPARRTLGLIVARGLAHLLVSFDGCHCIRPPKGGSMRWSMHAYGLAEDWNAGSNAYGEEPAMAPEVVGCFAESGFEWGGLWSTPDGMHFQLPWIKVRTDGNPLNPVVWMA